MKRLLRIFELSPNEQRVVLIIMLILITLGLVAYERRNHHSPIDRTVATQPKPSPTVVEALGDQ